MVNCNIVFAILNLPIPVPTLRLVRISIGNNTRLTLAGLQPGQWRELTDTERKILTGKVRSN